MSVMAVELGASRLLAPYFSSSQIVWTIIIGTIMIAMALGNIYGGRKADKDPNPDRLYRRIIIAALWIAAIPVFGKYLIIGISAVVIFSVNTNFLAIAAFASCMVIFVFPLFLLGTCTPCLVKYTVDSLNDSGRIVGMLNASNTIGSIIGTFIPTFITIPSVGTSITFLIFAGILLALSLIYFMSGRGSRAGFRDGASEKGAGDEPAKAGIAMRSAAVLICFALFCGFGCSDSFAFWEGGLAYEGESVYNYLQVKDNPDRTVLSTNVLFGVQSVYMKDSAYLTGMYYDYAMAAPFMLPVASSGVHEKPRVLILGMGTGTYATQLRRWLGEDSFEIEGVEIDDKITKLSYEFFEQSPEIPIATYDGRAYLAAVDESYDIIMVDAYQDITIPFQMSSAEFFTLVREHLSEEGIMVVNMNMRGQGEGTINQYLSDTIASVFGEVYTVDVPGNTNRELFAYGAKEEGKAGIIPSRLKAAAVREKNGELKKLLGRVEKGLEPYTAGSLILTDDKAPVELLGMRVIDTMIADEVAYYKDVYKEGGVQAVLDAL